MPIPTLAEKLEWLKPAPATQYEIECAAKVRQGDYEIGVQITNDILDEAMEVFVRSSRSYFGVSGDSMVAIFTANGDLINASCGTYLHAIIQPIVIKFVQKYYAENPGIREGDIWYTNDALYGGIHNPDQVALMPVFYKGKLLAWASAALHLSLIHIFPGNRMDGCAILEGVNTTYFVPEGWTMVVDSYGNGDLSRK